jgi:glycosyltransferase involved in cell wall biosynthesis
MVQIQEFETRRLNAQTEVLPVSVIIPTRNEAQNISRCLQSLPGVAEVFVVDSQSTDGTPEIARQLGANVIQFHYRGGWPKKRQWAMDSLPLTCDWILLLDADEILTPELVEEIRLAVKAEGINGYYIALNMYFLGRRLRHADASFWKLSLFRRGMGRFECRTRDQDASMADMEVHEHVIVDGSTSKLRNRLTHYNVNSLSQYIEKHNRYSNWEARVWGEPASSCELEPEFWGTQAQRRRFLRKYFLGVPGAPLYFFLYKCIFRLGFLDGVPGLIYCCLQGIQFFHIKAKIYELQAERRAKSRTCVESAA